MTKKKANKKEVEVKDNYNDYIIAVDISLNDSGVAVYSLSEDRIVYADHCSTEHIRRLKKYQGYNLNAIKLNIQREFFEEIKRMFPPSIVIFERGFARFRKDVEAINQINGVIYSIFWNYTQIKYPPKSVKAEILHGKAEKEQIRDVLLLNLPELMSYKDFYDNDNVSDAVAVLITYLLKTGVYKKANWNKGEHGKDVKVKRVAVQPKKPKTNIY